jgi:hypothetical protein
MITSETNYLLLKSSNIKINEHLRRDETIKIINSTITFKEIFDQMITMKERNDFEYKNAILGKSINLTKANQATDGKLVQVIILFIQHNH